MKILTALTYYRPHYSGLTIYAERLARALVGRGHQVSVLTSRYDRQLPAREIKNGVQIARLDVRARVSKGVIAPSILWEAWKWVRWADIVHLHLPQLDAAYLGLVARILRKPVVVTYHCDLHLPPGAINRLANVVSHLANHVTASIARVIVTNTQDYAENSKFLRRYMAKIKPVLPPAEVTPVTDEQLQAFRSRVNFQPGQQMIGMAARLATEKGVEYLAQAMPAILSRRPSARVLFVGQHLDVFGEQAYASRVLPQVESLGEHWSFLGNLPDADFSAFFHTCDVATLPSLNSTESFGMVQIESMLCGTPVVASNLPGVRQPVRITGMGKIVPPGDADSLALAILEILDHPQSYRGDPAVIRQQFAPEQIASEYESIFDAVLSARPGFSSTARQMVDPNAK